MFRLFMLTLSSLSAYESVWCTDVVSWQSTKYT